jgi:predicted nucleic acid-binding protein
MRDRAATARFSASLRHRLTAYDASYLALAAGEKRSLATLDNALAAAARTEGVTVVGPLA